MRFYRAMESTGGTEQGTTYIRSHGLVHGSPPDVLL